MMLGKKIYYVDLDNNEVNEGTITAEMIDTHGYRSYWIQTESGNTYRIKISVTTTSNSVSIKGYIDGVLICEYTDQENPYLGTIFGLRCAALTDSNSPHKIAIVSVTNNN